MERIPLCVCEKLECMGARSVLERSDIPLNSLFAEKFPKFSPARLVDITLDLPEFHGEAENS